MKRLRHCFNAFAILALMSVIGSCAQLGEIKEPFEIRKDLDSSDYQFVKNVAGSGEILPLKRPVVIKRLPYDLRFTTTNKKNNKADFPAVSTMNIMSTEVSVTFPEEQLLAMNFLLFGFESKSSAKSSEQWYGALKSSFVLDLSDYSFKHKNYPVVSSTREEQLRFQKQMDAILDAVRQMKSIENTYFNQPISDDDNEFLYEFTLAAAEFGIELNITANMRAVGMTTYLGYDGIVMDLSGTIIGSNNVFSKIEGYSVVSARDGAILFSKMVSRDYQGSEHGRLLAEKEETVVADSYEPL